jgi:hypothetical protein
VAQLLRDNAADSRVAEDVRALAAAYDDDAVAASVQAMEAARADDLALLAEAFAEPGTGESWWKDTAAQMLRYRGYLAAAVVVFAIVVFMHPAPRPLANTGDGDTALIPTSDAQKAAAASTAVVPPATDAFSDPFDFVVPEPTSDDAFATTPVPFDTTPQTYAPEPTALSISQSGYSSTFGGTPADQEPPAKGLPVESIGGQVTKYSYLRLVGSGASLKLKALTDQGASLNAEAARVQLCQLTTASWKPTRGTAPGDAPKYNAQCLEGHLASGVWTFTFSAVFNPVDPNGWAIVPITADNATFRVTFAPTAAA